MSPVMPLEPTEFATDRRRNVNVECGVGQQVCKFDIQPGGLFYTDCGFATAMRVGSSPFPADATRKAYSTEDVALTRITLSQVEFGSQNYSRAGLCCLPSRNRRRPPRIYLCWPHTRAVRHSFSNLAIQLRRRENEGYRKVEPERCHRIYLALAFGNSDSHFAPDISIAWLYINLGSK
jgi:hypothetical protein